MSDHDLSLGPDAAAARSAVPLLRLIYLSRATLAFDESDLGRIAAAAQRNNARDSITGALLYHEGSFLQVLEGPVRAAVRCFERVRCDGRHRDCELIASEVTATRFFGSGAMRPLRPPARYAAICARFLDFARSTGHKPIVSDALWLLRLIESGNGASA